MKQNDNTKQKDVSAANPTGVSAANPFQLLKEKPVFNPLQRVETEKNNPLQQVTQRAGTHNPLQFLAGRKSGGNGELPVQRKIRYKNQLLSFQSVYDGLGNPFLVGETKGNEIKKYQMKPVQNALNLTAVESMAVDYDPADDDGQARFHQNIERGRHMMLQHPSENDPSFYMASKDYKFKMDTKADISYFHNPDSQGLKYEDFSRHILERLNELSASALTFREFQLNAKKMIEGTLLGMAPLIEAENYRVPYAKEEFKTIVDAFNTDSAGLFKKRKKRKRSSSDKMSEEDAKRCGSLISEITPKVATVTTGLPWAGTGGKKNYAKTKGYNTKTTPDKFSGRDQFAGSLSPMRPSDPDYL